MLKRNPRPLAISTLLAGSLLGLVTIADLTLKRAMFHPIHVTAGSSTNTENTLIYNVHVIDAGQQAIKINQNVAKTHFPDNGTVACSHIALTDSGRPQVWTINGSRVGSMPTTPGAGLCAIISLRDFDR